MYTLAVKRDFVAQHFLIGGDWGPENEWHSHHYVVELQLEAETLDQHNYLVDIVDVETIFAELVGYFKDKTLNDLPEFADTNPSIEYFARIFHQAFTERLHAENITAICVKIWENDIAWASYRKEL
ncbi:MAG: 6-carboxytetrahydropterin synthase [Chloroflexota bacterium]